MLTVHDPAANEAVVRRHWSLMGSSRFQELDQTLAEDVVCEWPLTRERIRGRANYIGVNAEYPGSGTITIEWLVADGDRVATQCRLDWNGRIDFAISYFELRSGKIVKEVDWWPVPYAPPAGRERWMERMADDETPISP